MSMTDEISDRFSRTALLLGENAVKELTEKRVLIVGIGGVGGHAAEAIARCGIGRITLVDGDMVEPSNCNRQIIALSTTLGRPKAEVMAERCREIDPHGEFTPKTDFLRNETDIAVLLDNGFDFVVDAIDDVPVKTELVRQLVTRGIPFVSAMGAGGKTDPSAVRRADIAKTFGCPLARIMRKNLKALGIVKGVPTVFSPEPPLRTFTGRAIGSISYMPAIFGLQCAAEAIAVLSGFSPKTSATDLKSGRNEGIL